MHLRFPERCEHDATRGQLGHRVGRPSLLFALAASEVKTAQAAKGSRQDVMPGALRGHDRAALPFAWPQAVMFQGSMMTKAPLQARWCQFGFRAHK